MFNRIQQLFCNHEFQNLGDKALINTLEIETTDKCLKCGKERKRWYFNVKDICELKHLEG